MTTLKDLSPQIRLTMTNESAESRSAFGPGIAQLCQGVKETGSLNAAAKAMGMAYSKAWRIMNDTEEALGFRLIVRDGARGSQLTAEGAQLLEAYHTLSTQIKTFARESYQAAISSPDA